MLLETNAKVEDIVTRSLRVQFPALGSLDPGVLFGEIVPSTG